MVLRSEIDGRTKVDVGILKVDIGIDFKAMLSADETAEVRGIQIGEKGNGFNRIHGGFLILVEHQCNKDSGDFVEC